MAKKPAAAARPVATEPEVVVETPQQALTTLAPPDALAPVTQFLKGLVPVVTTALELEGDAKRRLAEAKLFVAPKNGDEDAKLQTFIKDAAQQKKRVEQHWTITSVVHNLHRRLTARRAVSVDALDTAQNLANRLHNDYVDAERRRVAREAEEQRLANERKAQQERDEELERLEKEALKREAASADLSEREVAFVDAYIGGIGTQGDPTASAKRAGYKNPSDQGTKLLATKKVKAAIDGKLEALRIREQAAAKSEQPLEVREVEEPVADIQGIGTDVKRWKGEVLDEAAFIEAFRSGKYGIPCDVFQVNPAKLNEYARSLQKRLDLWPGVRAVSTTKLQ